MNARSLCSTLFVCSLLVAPAARADSRQRDAATRRLRDDARGGVTISTHRATGAAKAIRLSPAARGLGKAAAGTEVEKQDRSREFFRDYGPAIGVSDPAALRHEKTESDDFGETHLTWKQFRGDVPVFAGTVKTHFDSDGKLKGVTGTALPDLAVNTTPTVSQVRAAEVALASAAAEHGASANLGVGSTRLWVYREGLAKGVPGPTHLAWEVEVTDGAAVRDFVYVSAHTGKVIDRITAVHDNLYRRAYDGLALPNPPPSYPAQPFWVEHDRFPTPSVEANNMIVASKEIYSVFWNAFKRDSFDDRGTKMDAIFNRGYSCPNASWNGVFISFCPGTTTDDVTAHEWGHAYTQYTHDLIYAWQPGALNESYSDIWGETVDRLNRRDGDARPVTPRTAGSCSVYSPPQGQLRVDQPAAIAGAYVAQSAGFGPALTPAGLSGDVSAPTPANGCAVTTPPPAGAVNPIALVDRGVCQFSQKVWNAEQAGYVGVIIANNTPTGLPGMGAGLDAEKVTIPSLGVQQAVGTAIRAQLAAGTAVVATLRAAPGTDASVRWLMGEDSTAFNGAIRDMWNPPCYSNPGKVSDTAYYVCATADNGGVHTNSGVPNHAFALLVDGGTFNGQTVSAIGLVKAAHIYYRAQNVYQVADSDFADHALALRFACEDLTGKRLKELDHPNRSKEIIRAADCAQVDKAIAAVELETPPTFCGFQPLLAKDPPPLCGAGTTDADVHDVRTFHLEDPAEVASFAASFTAVTPADFTARTWEWSAALPDRSGSGFFAPDPDLGTCSPGGDESGVLHLVSPEITLPATATEHPRATFWHWVATEAGFDGGNLSVSVNGGAWTLVPRTAFTFNRYNVAALATAAQGNTNPLAGQPAWTGGDGGSVGGSWGRTDLDLAAVAARGDRIQLRWDLGNDGCGGVRGWFLDDIQIYTCTGP
jgi:Zn-dependent metalloprotease